MEKHYLLQFKDDYADEFDAYGSVIIDEDQYKYFYSEVAQAVKTGDYSKLDEDFTSDVYVGLGTNEDIQYDNIADLMNQVKCTELTEEEYNVLMKFKFNYFGFTGFWDIIADSVVDEDDDEDDSDD